MTLPFRRRHHDDEAMHDRARALTSHEMVEPIGDEDASWLAGHLDVCAECRRDREAYLGDRELLRSLRDRTPEPPRDLWARTSAALDREARSRSTRGSGARSIERRTSGSWRGGPLGAAAGVLILLIVIGASSVPPIVSPGQTLGGTQAAVATPGGQPTPIKVAAGHVGWIRPAADGSWEIVFGDVAVVCPRARPGCKPLGEDVPGRPVNLGNAPTGMTISPAEDQLVVESLGHDAAPDRIIVVPVPAATPAGTPGPNATTVPTAGPETTPASPAPTSEVAPGVIEIASGIAVVGETAYSADGQWLAFSARPSDGSTGPDLYLWHVGDPTAVPVTTDHQTYFSAWLGNQVLASRVALPAVPAESPALETPEATESTADSTADTSGASEAPTVEAHPSSFLLDPATLAETAIAQPDVWLPVVDPTGRFVAYWAGTLRGTADGLDWQLGTGRLVLDGWSTGTTSRPDASAGANLNPGASPSPVGPIGSQVSIVEGQTAAFTAKFDPTGTRLAVWVGEQLDATLGRLHLLVLDPLTGAVNAAVAPLPGVPALRRFSIDTGRLAWVSPPGQDGQESSVQVLGWSHDDFGEIRTIPARELYIVR
jgi:WD40-like Beta Propeller Repeat.